ncbi:Hypothetical protein I595_404 [Croceitalea dokdonensis DOKDO 023]|uniref:Uncharacterized protein n=1 Tax=Croceitalea dokdonensis DOKDO 023 TaxID=1300341 RepID=A0A0P7AZ28_9FLAO|nr:Hypothetical protein I595_404 [Croceitalea dokdonensis DOKDO 023]
MFRSMKKDAVRHPFLMASNWFFVFYSKEWDWTLGFIQFF